MVRDQIRPACSLFLTLCLMIAGAVRGADRSTDSPIVLEEFEVPGDGDGLWVPVAIGGAERIFLVDTGCTGVLYDKSLQPLLGEPRFVQHWHSSGGLFRVEFFAAPAARLGRLDLHPAAGQARPLAGCVDLSSCSGALGVDMGGQVGMSFLKRYVVRIDFDRGKLSFLTSSGPDAGVPFPLEFERGVPRISVEVPGAGEKTFEIDTGHVGVSGSLNADVMRHLAERGLIRGIGTNVSATTSRIAPIRTLRVASFKVGNFEHPNLVFDEDRSDMPSHLGMGYLSRFIVTFDFPNGMLYLKPGKNFLRRDRGLVGEGCWELGLELSHHQGTTIVGALSPGGQAAKAGVERFDTLLAVNGVNVSGARLFAIHRLITDARGDVRLTIERGTSRREFVVRRPLPLVVANPDASHDAR